MKSYVSSLLNSIIVAAFVVMAISVCDFSREALASGGSSCEPCALPAGCPAVPPATGCALNMGGTACVQAAGCPAPPNPACAKTCQTVRGADGAGDCICD